MVALHGELADNLQSQQRLVTALAADHQVHQAALAPLIANLEQAVTSANQLVAASTAELQELTQSATTGGLEILGVPPQLAKIAGQAVSDL